MISRRRGSAIALKTSVVVAARAMMDYIPIMEYVKNAKKKCAGPRLDHHTPRPVAAQNSAEVTTGVISKSTRSSQRLIQTSMDFRSGASIT